jgi:GTPase SAR1 family protein
MCGGGGGEEVDPAQKAANDAAMKELGKAKSEDDKVIKMLLLGAGESGKSTIFKQMKIINKDGYSEAERKGFVGIVHSNTIQSMRSLMEGIEKLEIAFPSDLTDLKKKFDDHEDNDAEKLTPSIAAIIKQMWEHKTTQEGFGRKNEFQLNDSADYYFNDIDRISVDGYIPTEQDVLRSRVRTTGIVQSDFVIKKINFMMFDVGGQRNERRKWIHAFDNVNAVVFVAALSEYDQVLYEDENMNRMDEALSLFDQICNSKWFAQTSMILFLNKKDLFEMKLSKNSLSKFMTDYTGPDEFGPASEFLKKKFLERCKNKEKQIYSHATCATDTSNVKFVFDSVVSIILEENMKASGLA